MIYGESIKQARELRGLTQTELAKRIKVTQGRIAQIEGEFREIAGSILAEIAYHTQLPTSYFSRAPENWLSPGSLLFRARTSISKREVTQSLRDAEHVFGLAHTMARNLDIAVSLSPIEGSHPRDAGRKPGRGWASPLQSRYRIWSASLKARGLGIGDSRYER